jgi:lauroyl/myristoyl acyltransferase
MSKAFLIRAGTFLLKVMPYGLARVVAITAGNISWLFLKERRRILEGNLSHIASQKTPAERRKLVRSTFRNFALCSIDFLKLPLMSKQEVADLVEIYGLENLDQALAGGKGAILVTGHLGTWDFAGAFLAALGYPIHAVVEDIEPETYKVFEQYREATGMKTISLERGALPSLRVLKKKELLVLVGDRAIHGQGLAVDFCGGKRVIPGGPAAFVLKTGASLVIGYMIINPRGSRKRYKAVIGPVMKPEAVGARDEQGYTQAVADALCEGIRAYPDQWFVFQPQWVEKRGL